MKRLRSNQIETKRQQQFDEVMESGKPRLMPNDRVLMPVTIEATGERKLWSMSKSTYWKIRDVLTTRKDLSLDDANHLVYTSDNLSRIIGPRIKEIARKAADVNIESNTSVPGQTGTDNSTGIDHHLRPCTGTVRRAEDRKGGSGGSEKDRHDVPVRPASGEDNGSGNRRRLVWGGTETNQGQGNADVSQPDRRDESDPFPGKDQEAPGADQARGMFVWVWGK